MRPMIPISWLVKTLCVAAIWLVMLAGAPPIIQRWIHPSTAQTVPERLATDEANLQTLQKQMDILEHTSSGNAERLAALEAKQDNVLKILLGIALFMATHVIENWQRWRGNYKTRAGDRQSNR